MKPDLLQFEEEYGKKLTIVKVDVRNPESAEYKQYMKLDDSKYVPHTILIDSSNKVLNKHTGAMTRETLRQFVSQYLGS